MRGSDSLGFGLGSGAGDRIGDGGSDGMRGKGDCDEGLWGERKVGLTGI